MGSGASKEVCCRAGVCCDRSRFGDMESTPFLNCNHNVCKRLPVDSCPDQFRQVHSDKKDTPSKQRGVLYGYLVVTERMPVSPNFTLPSLSRVTCSPSARLVITTGVMVEGAAAFILSRSTFRSACPFLTSAFS